MYLKPPGSCAARWPKLSIAIEVECCDSCMIYILDTCAQVQIADCKNCRIVVAPCAGSVFLLDCVNCRVSVATKQLRLRDMKGCELRTFAPTHESSIIETSSDLHFGCWDIAYKGLQEQVTTLGWESTTNHWQQVYDFSPATAGSPPNWALMSEADQETTRWCELAVHPEGIAGGTVDEVCGAQPSLPGSECPFAAADGTQFIAEWYSPEVTLTAPPAAPTAMPPTPAAAGGAVPLTVISEPGARSLIQRVVEWVSSAFSALFGPNEDESTTPAPIPKPIVAGTTSTTSTSCTLQ